MALNPMFYLLATSTQPARRSYSAALARGAQQCYSFAPAAARKLKAAWMSEVNKNGV